MNLGGKEAWMIWRRALRGDARLTAIDAAPGETVFRFLDHRAGSCSLSVRSLHRYSLGVDIVGYRRRSRDGQIVLSASILAAIEMARDLLRSLCWLPEGEPQELIFTGDGAILLVDTLASAIALLFATNTLIADANRGAATVVDPALDRPPAEPILPWRVRYAVASGETVNLLGPPESRVLGPAVSDCHRILAASNGPDLLIQDAVMCDLDAQGGINGIARAGGCCDWAQRLSTEPVVAGGPKGVVVHRAFGTHGAARLLAEVARQRVAFTTAPDGPSRVYDIGASPPVCET